jgi:pimeloyl-ACP methyl ester carboxylesterase
MLTVRLHDSYVGDNYTSLKNEAGYQGYLTNGTINGQIAQQEKGATIVFEHRFFGLSNPYNNLTVQSLQLLTLDQSTADVAYFAENVVLPMPGGDQVAPGEAPWFLVGGSYSGALVSWTMVQRPDVFWAGYASSAVVEAITYVSTSVCAQWRSS